MLFTINDLEMGCSQQSEYDHILAFLQKSGWIETCVATTARSALNSYVRAKRRTVGLQPKILGALPTACSGLCLPAVRGATFRQNSGIGIGPYYTSRVGAIKLSERVLLQRCEPMPAWNMCHARPLLVPSSTRPAPNRSRRLRHRSLARWITTKLHIAAEALFNPLLVVLSAEQITDIDEAEALIKIEPQSDRAIFSRFERFTCITTRYDKLAKSYLSFNHLARVFI